MNLAEIIVSEIERDRSSKVFKLFAERVGQAGKPSAVHPQRVIPLLTP